MLGKKFGICHDQVMACIQDKPFVLNSKDTKEKSNGMGNLTMFGSRWRGDSIGPHTSRLSKKGTLWPGMLEMHQVAQIADRFIEVFIKEGASSKRIGGAGKPAMM